MAKTRIWALSAIAAALVIGPACSSRQGLGGNDNCDYLLLAESSDNGSAASETLNCSPSDLVRDFTVNIQFLGPTAENGGLGDPPDPTTSSQFLLEHYDVTYVNETNGGGSVPGVDVPNGFRESIQAVFDLTDDQDLELTGFPVLKAGAKNSPPLNDDSFFPANGNGVVFTATMTWWGHPVTDDNAWCYAIRRYVITVIPC
jgi:hypothetical protein